MKLKQGYEKLTDRVYDNQQAWYKQLDEVIKNPSMIKENLYDIITSQKLKKDLASTVATLTITHPINAFFETRPPEPMANLVSAKARLYGTILSYGMIAAFMEGRNRIKKRFNITKESKWYKKHGFDLAYIASFLFPLRALNYRLSGETDFMKIGINALIVTGVGTTLGQGLLKIMDAYRDLIGLDDTDVLPERIKKKSRKLRTALAVGYASLGIMATAMVYVTNPYDGKTEQIKKPDKEHVLILDKPMERPGIEELINQKQASPNFISQK